MAKKQPKAPQPKVVVRRLISELTYDPENARKHGDADLEAICKSLTKFTQQTPIVVTPCGTVVKGNGTMTAAQKLGWTHIDTVVTYLTGNDLKAYSIADNQTALLSEWDDEKLSEQLVELEEAEFDMDCLGFPAEQLVEMIPEEVNDSPAKSSHKVKCPTCGRFR